MGRVLIWTPADKAVKFINNLSLTEEFAGQPMFLNPWQESIVRRMYELRPDGRKKIRRVLLLLPRKNSKTQMAATLNTEHLFNTDQSGRVALCAATDRYAAGHLFRKVVSIIEADPFLSRQCRIYSSTKRIETKRGNILQVMSSDGKRSHGENPSLVTMDECWCMPNSDLYDALTSGFGARKEYCTLMISTQGNRKDTFLYQEYEYACKVRDGIVDDPEYLPCIFESKPEDDWTSESTWIKCNPSITSGFGNLDFLRSEFAKAKEILSEESKFRQFYLNQLVASDSKWINQIKWQACNENKNDPEVFKTHPSYWALDLSNTSDITALVGVCKVEELYHVMCYFWIPGDYAKKRDRKGHTQYQNWARKRLIEFTDGDEIDYPYLEKKIPEILKPFKVKSLYCDPYNATSTTQRLKSLGLPVTKFRQGWQSMSDPIKFTEVLISKGQLALGKNEVLDWMAANAVTHRDRQDNLTLDKERSVDKIDGIVSLVMSIAGSMHASLRTNVYSTRGFESLVRK